MEKIRVFLSNQGRYIAEYKLGTVKWQVPTSGRTAIETMTNAKKWLTTSMGRHHATVTSASPKKVAKDIEAAVRAAQLYIGSATASPIRYQQRLYSSMRRKITAVAKRRGMDETSAYEQILSEAQSRGGITPAPGKDV